MKKKTYQLIESINNSLIKNFPYLTAKEHSEVMENIIYTSIKHNLLEKSSFNNSIDISDKYVPYFLGKEPQYKQVLKNAIPTSKEGQRVLDDIIQKDYSPEKQSVIRSAISQIRREIDGEDTDTYRHVDPEDLTIQAKNSIALIAALTGGTLASAAVLYKKYGPGIIKKLKNKVSPSKLSKIKNKFKKFIKLSEALSDKQIKADIETAKDYAYWMNRYRTEKDPKEKDRLKQYTIEADKDESKRHPLMRSTIFNQPHDYDKTDSDKNWRYYKRAQFSHIGREIDGEDTDPYRTWDPDDKILGKYGVMMKGKIRNNYPKNQKRRHIDGEDFDPYRNVDLKDLTPPDKAPNRDLNPEDLISSNKAPIALIAALTGSTLASAAVLYKKYGPGLISKLKAKIKPSKLSQVKNTFKKLMKKIKLAEAKNMI